MAKRIVIIGGGLAGLSAGIYGQLEGYETVIYEKSNAPGGCVSAWKRGEYTIDNCIHWLCGSREGAVQYKMWTDIGALDENTRYLKRESFYQSELNGQTIALWRDLERTEREMLALSPEDAEEIGKFIRHVRTAQELISSMEEDRTDKSTRSGKPSRNPAILYAGVARALVESGGLTLNSWSKKFKHPLLRQLILDFSAKEYEAYWLAISYAIFSDGDADVPIGGSLQLIQKVVDKYLSLGGCLHYNAPVEKIVLDTDPIEAERILTTAVEASEGIRIVTQLVKGSYETATGILLESGKFIPADYVICACDLSHTFSKLLAPKYAPASYKELHKEASKRTVYSSFQVAFAVEGLMEEVSDTLGFSCDPIDVGTQVVTRLVAKNYRAYGDYIAPKGHTVIQTSLIQYGIDHRMWLSLKKDNPTLYKKKKEYTANAILEAILKRFPHYKGRIRILDVWTPASYSERLNCHEGAYMRFITTLANTNAFLPIEVKDIHNVYLASHWLRYPGGTPTAVSTAKDAVAKIVNSEKTFKIPNPLTFFVKKKPESALEEIPTSDID